MQIFLVVLRAASLLALIFSVFLSLVKLMGQKDMDCATFRTLSASASILTSLGCLGCVAAGMI